MVSTAFIAPRALKEGPRVRRGDHGHEFILVSGQENGGREIVFGRTDVSEIQLAKGAMRAGGEHPAQARGHHPSRH